jgi:hypothetical protein
MSHWIWRGDPKGAASVTCTSCGATYSGDPDAVARLEAAHDPQVCAVQAQTPQARRLRGAR